MFKTETILQPIRFLFSQGQIICVLFFVFFSGLSAQVYIGGGTVISVKDSTFMYNGTIVHLDADKKLNIEPNVGNAKIFILKGTLVSQLPDHTETQVLYIDPLSIKNKESKTRREVATKPVKEIVQNKVQKPVFVFRSSSKDDLHFRKADKVIAVIANPNTHTKKLEALGTLDKKASFLISSELENSKTGRNFATVYFSVLKTFRSRPPPHFYI